MNQSPTGNPLLPAKVVPFLLLLAAIAQALVFVLPEHTLGAKIAQGVVAVLAMLGLASPGLRSAPPAGPPSEPGIQGLVKLDKP